ncbi:EAL domain-containing protein [Pseudomonas sp. N040]|uniref:EAL domain-containing protein n=1 Tax=Pseudomonas sp. N040 TaxID=2785325 RepID=UPI0018A2F3BD|nr:EAL domain-containing protein [Pseudomonas sp. N040]MBF7728518.1 EAL domain-containing protein [Pseudomonas sp. N040]MBW7012158.1 EAL domain-containing protein [Pseudomonas sp. N040]
MALSLRWLLGLVCWLALSAQMAHASLPLTALSQAQAEEISEIAVLRLLEDKDSALQIRTALPLLKDAGETVHGRTSLGYSSSTYWAGFSLSGPSGSQFLLELGNPFIDEIEMWVYIEGQLALYRATGDLHAFSARAEPFPAFLLPLPTLGRASTQDIVLRIHSSSNLSLPLRLVPESAKANLIAAGWTQSGLIFGALLIIGLFHLAKFTVLRERQLGYYTISVLLVSWYYASISGLTSLLLWPDLPLAQPIETNLTGGLTLCFSTLFILSTLNLQQRWISNLRNLLFCLILVIEMLVLLDLSDHRWARLSTLMTLVAGIFQLGVSLYALRLKRQYSKEVILIWSAVLLVMLLLPLVRTGVLPRHPLLLALTNYLPVISVFLFGLLNGRQLENVRKQLISSQTEAIDNLEQYRALFKNASEGIFRSTPAGNLLEANPSMMRMLGLHQSDLRSLRRNSLAAMLKPGEWAALVAQLSVQRPHASGEFQLRGLDGATHWVHLSLHIQSGQDNVEGVVVDFSERRQLEQELSRLAAHDPLTGLLNRRELERQLQESIDGSGGRFAYLLYLDLDQFKQVNDLCGHTAGDLLLRQLSSSMQAQLPAHAVLARIGGDEFAILLGESDLSAAIRQAEVLRNGVEQFVFSWEGRPFRLFVSIGLLELNDNVSDWQTALSWADSASQLAKHHGRNRVHCFNPEDRVLLENQRQLQWISRLREAIELNQFELFFQPVLSLQQQEPGWHYEVLLRYRDPRTHEWIAPGQFLVAAERYGFLVAIDRWVLMRLCQWLAENPKHRAQLGQVNINLTAPSLLDQGFHDLLGQLLDQHQLPAQKICIEVTEMVALGELGASAEWIAGLRARGLKVALDDFGSGFASYAYLRKLPLDLLKIDGAFINNIENDPINQAMVRSMVQIARKLGLRTVAEFVENQASLDCLKQLGIDYAQGYFIGRPQPLEQLADLPLESLPENVADLLLSGPKAS